MKVAPDDDPDFQRVIKVATRAFEGIAELRDPASCLTKKTHASRDGRKCKATEICVALFSWFVDVRGTLKGPFRRSLFKLKGISYTTNG